MAENDRKNNALQTGISIIINLLILLGLVALFFLAFDFAYKVFANDVYNPASTKTVTVVISESDTPSTIGSKLEDLNIIKDKYAFSLRIRFSKYNNKIKPGTYEVSASMSTDKILSLFVGDELEQQEE